MSGHKPDKAAWAAGILFVGLAGFIGYTLPRNSDTPKKTEPAVVQAAKPVASSVAQKHESQKVVFKPPGEDEIPKNEFGDMVRLGEKLFSRYAKQRKRIRRQLIAVLKLSS